MNLKSQRVFFFGVIPFRTQAGAEENTFSHLVASVVADAMGVATYSGLAAQLCSEGLELVEDLEQLQPQRHLVQGGEASG